MVGLVHCQVHGYEGEHDRYAPCIAADLAGRGYGYWALGHVHTAVGGVGRAAGLVPGLPAGPALRRDRARRARSTSRSAPTARRVEFRPLAPVRWQELVLDDLGDVPPRAACVEQLRRGVRRPRAAAAACCRTRTGSCASRLGGRTPFFAELRGAEAADDLALALRERLGVLAVEVRDEGVMPPVDVTELRGRSRTCSAPRSS